MLKLHKALKIAAASAAAISIVAASVLPALAAGPLKQSGSTTVYPITASGESFFESDYPGIDVQLAQGGSGAGINALLRNEVDVAAASRAITSSDAPSGAAYNYTQVQSTTIGKDAIVVIANVARASCLNNLTAERIADIWGDTGGGASGTVYWDEIGCTGHTPIVPRSRIKDSGTYVSFYELVSAAISNSDHKLAVGEENTRIDAAGAPARLAGNPDVVAAIAANPDQLGYVGLGFVDDSPSVYGVSVNGVAGTADNVINDSYPLRRSLFLMMVDPAVDTDSPDAGTYVNWYATGNPKGQMWVAAEQFVPVGRPSCDCNNYGSGDRNVNVSDLVAIGLVWGQTGSRPEDVNYDSNINIGDITGVGLCWGTAY